MLDKIKQKVSDFISERESPAIEEFASKLHSGKMLRSKLMLAICPNDERILTLCAIVEMIQSASLLHDDVLDDSVMRRGEASINALFGDKNAIMLGDVFYSKAFYELLAFGAPIARSIADCVVRLSRGEIHDVLMAESFQASREKYFAMIEDKTASLIASSAQSAAILAGLDGGRYYSYGLNLGIAFQIVDDMLDVFGDEALLGKPALNDYTEGKTTLPYLLLYEVLGEADRATLQGYFKSSSAESKAWILEQMQKYGIFARCQEIAKSYGERALESIANEGNARLEQVIIDMIYRKF